MPLAAAAETVWQMVSPRLAGFTVEVLPELDSTNSELMRRARTGQQEPILLVAQQQTAGRGRLGRQWHSDTQALTFSLGLRLAPPSWAGLSLAVGAAVAESLHSAIQLKWPNDLWVGGSKLGGILIETAGHGEPQAQADDRGRYAVIGVGINIVAPGPDAAYATRPVGLRSLWPDCDAGQTLVRVALPLVNAVLAFADAGFAPFQARFNVRDALRDQPVALSDGLIGTAHGVDLSGALLVHTAAGMKPVISSEVSVRPIGQHLAHQP